MGKNVCPVCKKTYLDSQIVEVGDGQPDTELCTACHKIRFFKYDVKEIKYRLYYKQLEAFVKKNSDKYFDEDIHGRQIQQLARCEVQVEHYEKIIGNNDEKNEGVLKQLQNERVHLRAMYNILQASIQSLKGDKKVHEHDLPTNFKELLKIGYKQAAEEDDGKTG